MEEQQQKIGLEQQKREKKEFMDAKQKMLAQLAKDKEERFGKKAGGAAVGQASAAVENKKQVLEGVELVKHGIKTVRTLYTEDRQPGVAKTAFKTISVYLGNVMKDPNEDKFKKINLGNEAF